jgi:hypothetical protein
MPVTKNLKHKRYTKMRVYRDGRKEVYNSDSNSWITYAAIAYMLSDHDKSTVNETHEDYSTSSPSYGEGEGGGGGASSSWDSGSSSSDSSSSDSGSSDSGSCGSSD